MCSPVLSSRGILKVTDERVDRLWRGEKKRTESSSRSKWDLCLNELNQAAYTNRFLMHIYNSRLAVTEFWGFKIRIISEFRWTEALLAHSRMTVMILWGYQNLASHEGTHKIGSWSDPSRRVILMKCWPFSCIYGNLYASQYSKWERKGIENCRRFRQIKRSKTTINQKQGGGPCLDADLNQPPKMVRRGNVNTHWILMK